MIIVDEFDPEQNPNGGTFKVGSSQPCCTLIIKNESPHNIVLDIPYMSGDRNTVIHAWDRDLILLTEPVQSINWTIQNSLNTVDPPSSLVTIVLYMPNETATGTYPAPLIRQSNVGNPTGVTTNTQGSGSMLKNDGNAANSQILETTVTGQTNSNQTATNDGLWMLASIIAGAIVPWLKSLEPSVINSDLLQLGSPNYITHVLGQLLVDQATTLTGAVTATNASNNILAANVPATGVNTGTLGSGVLLSSKAPTASVADSANSIAAANIAAGSLPSSVMLTSSIAGSQVTSNVANANYANSTGYLNSGSSNFAGKLGQNSDGDTLDVSGGGPMYAKAPNGGFVFQSPSGTNKWTRTAETFGNTGFFSGSITVTHNLGYVPDRILLTPYSTSGGSTTYTMTGKTSTTFTMYAYTSMSFDWVCIKF